MPPHLLYRQHVATAAMRASSPTRQAMASRQTWTQLTPAVEATTAQRWKGEKWICFELLIPSYIITFFVGKMFKCLTSMSTTSYLSSRSLRSGLREKSKAASEAAASTGLPPPPPTELPCCWAPRRSWKQEEVRPKSMPPSPPRPPPPPRRPNGL